MRLRGGWGKISTLIKIGALDLSKCILILTELTAMESKFKQEFDGMLGATTFLVADICSFELLSGSRVKDYVVA